MKIVVIDDSPTNLVVLGSLTTRIKNSGYVAFSDSERAIEHLMCNDADVIVVDYSMPKITGVELIKRMRASVRHAATPIIMVTSSAELAVRRRALEVGATAFISKPVKPVEFLATMQELASQSEKNVDEARL